MIRCNNRPSGPRGCDLEERPCLRSTTPRPRRLEKTRAILPNRRWLPRSTRRRPPYNPAGQEKPSSARRPVDVYRYRSSDAATNRFQCRGCKGFYVAPTRTHGDTPVAARSQKWRGEIGSLHRRGRDNGGRLQRRNGGNLSRILTLPESPHARPDRTRCRSCDDFGTSRTARPSFRPSASSMAFTRHQP